MRATAPTILPEQQIEKSSNGYGGWIVTVFNNEVNTYDEVIMILMVATGCSIEEAFMETWEVDHLGRSVVHHGHESECLDVSKIVASIGLRVEVSEE